MQIFNSIQRTKSFIQYTLRRFFNENSLQVASALTFTSLLALVPLMTIGFAALSVFPAFEHTQKEAKAWIFSNLVPSVGETVLTYIDKFSANAGQLTGFGLIGLAVTSIMLLSTIVGAFNTIWRVSESRSFTTRFLAFWAILTLTPILFGLSLSISGTLSHLLQTIPFPGLTKILVASTSLFKFALGAIGLTALFMLIPNRSVEWRHALLGGATTAILFTVTRKGFVFYLKSFAAYQTIYGALALIPTFLLWLYIAWSILLLGAMITSSLPEWLSAQVVCTEKGLDSLSPSQRLIAALGVLGAIYHSSHATVGLCRSTLLRKVPLGGALLDTTLEQLRKTNWLARIENDTWIIGRDLSEGKLYDLIHDLGVGLRGYQRGLAGFELPRQKELRNHLEQADKAAQEYLNIPVKDWL